MQSAKEKKLSVIKNLPNDASYDEIMETLYINGLAFTSRANTSRAME